MNASPGRQGGRGHGADATASKLHAQGSSTFAELTDKAIRRGVFHSAPDLIAAIEQYLAAYNQDPKPFVWTAEFDKVIEKIAVSMHDNEQYFFEALKAGASGYVLKSAANRDLVEAIRASMRGEPFLYPAAVTALIRDYLELARTGERVPEDPLTPREREVVKLIAEGHTSEEIAELLVISKKTVERHRANILEKLGLRNRVELTRYAIRRGLVEP